MKEILKQVIAKSPEAARDAVKCLQAIAEGSPMAQIRFRHVIEVALGDPQANFAESERAEMAVLLIDQADGQETGRTATVRFRVTETERMLLRDLAANEGVSESEFIRRKVFG